MTVSCRIAKLDRRIGNCTVLACNKWQEIFKECENSLGVSGDAANDVFSAWNKLASDAFHRRTLRGPQGGRTGGGGGGGGAGGGAFSHVPPRRANSLTGLHGRSVKLPVQLIPLERARAQTSISSVRDDQLLASLRNAGLQPLASEGGALGESFMTSTYQGKTDEYRPEISHPLNMEESTFCCSYPSGLSYKISVSPYAPQADLSEARLRSSPVPPLLSSQARKKREEGEEKGDEERESGRGEVEPAIGPEDVRAGIQSYVDRAFGTPDHPLGALMNRLELVYRLSYGGIGANKFLLPHAIAETHSIIQRIHSIVR